MFDNETVSLHHNNHQLFMVETNETAQSYDNRLLMSRGLTEFDRDKIFQLGTVYITHQINPVDWDTQLFM